MISNIAKGFCPLFMAAKRIQAAGGGSAAAAKQAAIDDIP
jgi:hypothetical protein